eukprot:CAMPEP_0201971582 /NCGR_PEP_ID=MMETSP0904-20121228/37667_1 /ASSEMBLY_ACC=CAM_ASM_000553 /TAXON_ID=420261 /ORGANISM="Thalassiosira antarctica, Strain CCMP982" /LENGTH=87 /DNA_ID=CAMNT_0048521061 /DNA_START=71 /DNA_END=334 /DNA_ORIENTATION=-
MAATVFLLLLEEERSRPRLALQLTMDWRREKALEYPSVLSVVGPEFGTAAASLIPSCNDDISAMALLDDAEVWVEGVVVKCLSIAAK